MGLFKNLSQAKVSRDYIFLNQCAGNYLTRIDAVKVGKQWPDGRDTRTRKREEFIAIEETIIAILSSNEAPPLHAVGDEVSHFIMVTGSEYADKEWASFLCGLFGLKGAEDLDRPEIKALVGGIEFDDWAGNEDAAKGVVQPLRGVVVEINNRMRALKKVNPTDPDKFFCKVHTKREVPAVEVLQVLTAMDKTGGLVNRFFPNNFLQNKIAEEAAVAK